MEKKRFISSTDLPGIVIDGAQAKLIGDWARSAAVGNFVGTGYHHDGDTDQGGKSARFETRLKPGRYEVRISYSASPNRADNVSVTIQHADGADTVTVNQRVKPSIDGLFTSLGEYRFDASQPAAVIFSNTEANGHVVVDAVQFVPAAE